MSKIFKNLNSIFLNFKIKKIQKYFKTLHKKLALTYHFNYYVNTLKAQEHKAKVLSVYRMHFFYPLSKVLLMFPLVWPNTFQDYNGTG